jgi:hypothetical protein
MFNLNAGETPARPPRKKERPHVQEIKKDAPHSFANLRQVITVAGLSGGALALIFNRMAKENNPQAVQQEVNKALNESQKIEQPTQTAEQQSETPEFTFDQPIPIDAVRVNNWSTIVANLGIPHSYEINQITGRKEIALNQDYEVTIIDDTGKLHELPLSQAVKTFQLKPGHEVTIHSPQPEQKDTTQPESKQAPADQEAQTQLNPQETIDQTIASVPQQKGFEVAQPPAEKQTQAEQITEEQSQARPTLEQTA